MSSTRTASTSPTCGWARWHAGRRTATCFTVTADRSASTSSCTLCGRRAPPGRWASFTGRFVKDTLFCAKLCSAWHVRTVVNEPLPPLSNPSPQGSLYKFSYSSGTSGALGPGGSRSSRTAFSATKNCWLEWPWSICSSLHTCTCPVIGFLRFSAFWFTRISKVFSFKFY